MIYIDQHIHCQCSPDSHTPLREMAAAARDHGMSAVCFTDHIDMDFGNLGDLRWEPRKDILRAAWADVRENPVEGITVRCGIELGEANHDPAAAKEAALEPGLDFVCRACEYYGVSADYLLGRTDEPGGETAPRLHALAEELRALAARVENAH